MHWHMMQSDRPAARAQLGRLVDEIIKARNNESVRSHASRGNQVFSTASGSDMGILMQLQVQPQCYVTPGTHRDSGVRMRDSEAARERLRWCVPCV